MITLFELPNFPLIKGKTKLPQKIIEVIEKEEIKLNHGDILCVASKLVSISENRKVDLTQIEPSSLAKKINKKIPRKDPRLIQVIIDETRGLDGEKIVVKNNTILGKLPNGLILTSSGVDRFGEDEAVLLPLNPDESALKIGRTIFNKLKTKVGVIITDSDGREDKKGSNQVAIGIYGVPALRKKKTTNEKETVETFCDLVASAAGLIMGQKYAMNPIVIIRGAEFEFDEESRITSALN